jgi:hypothetical protein
VSRAPRRYPDSGSISNATLVRDVFPCSIGHSRKISRRDEVSDLKPAVPDLYVFQLGILLLYVAGADRGRRSLTGKLKNTPAPNASFFRRFR